MTTRRGFLGAMLAACAAPAIVRADSLMRVIPRETEIILPPAPAEVLHSMDDLLASVGDGNGTFLTTLGDGSFKLGDIISIGGLMGLGGGAQRFRITGIEGPSFTIAGAVPPAIAAPAAPWFRQHEKRGRR